MKHRIKKTRKNIPYFGFGAILLAISMFQLFGATSSIASRFWTQPNASYVLGTYNIAAKYTVNDLREEGFVPMRIKMDSVGINLDVASVGLSHGTWPVNDRVANYAVETSIVNLTSGNVGIFGHDLPSVFTPIKSLQTGDTIELSNPQYKAVYKVSSKDITEPTAVELFYPTQAPSLTLVTCDGIFSQQRYIVKAELVSIEDLK